MDCEEKKKQIRDCNTKQKRKNKLHSKTSSCSTSNFDANIERNVNKKKKQQALTV